MAPLSRELSGVILPHDHFGNHLDSSGRTVNEELELRNFSEAGKVLEEIWTGVQIDNYPVVASYICPPASDIITGLAKYHRRGGLHMFESHSTVCK